ncbi:hypothetical protein HETIRDRAFT_233377, partial [Heterobasidion irregulare TC 32-1]
RTNRAIDLLIEYALNTSLLTTMFAIATLITFVTMDKTLVYTPFFMILVRLYSCSFMSTLNSRDVVRQELDGSGSEVVDLSRMSAMEGTESQLREE